MFFSILWQKISQIFIYLLHNKLSIFNLLNINNNVYFYSNKSSTCDWATMFLNENGIEAVNLHGDMPYEIRLGKFKKYQDGIVNIMVSTDVGSRGLNTIRVI